MKRLATSWSIRILVALGAASCATSGKPCAAGGDLDWPTKSKGDRMCMQEPTSDGRLVNHGKFIQYFPNGKVELEGEFKWGRKHGVWTQYNEQGEKTQEKYFENGVERSMKDR